MVSPPKLHSSEHIGKLGSFTTFFQNHEKVLDIVIHVSHDDTTIQDRIVKSIKFGYEQAINNETNRYYIAQLVVSAIFILHCIYTIGLFLFGVRQKSFIYFSLLLLTAAMAILLDDDRLLLSWIPLNVTWTLKLLLINYNLIILFMYLLHRFSQKRKIK